MPTSTFPVRSASSSATSATPCSSPVSPRRPRLHEIAARCAPSDFLNDPAEIRRKGGREPDRWPRGRLLSPPFDIPVGRVAVVADPFDNVLVLIDLSKGRYATDELGTVTAVVKDA
jgi:hypothetical protein